MLSILLVGRAGASPPSRTNSMIFLYIYLYIYLYPFNRTSCPKSSTCFFFSDISIFLRRKCYTRFFFSGISIFRNLHTYVRIYVIHTYAMRHGIVRRPPWILLFFLPFPRACAPRGKNGWLARLGFFGPEGRVLNKGRRDSERRLAYRDRPRARRGSETATQRKLD